MTIELGSKVTDESGDPLVGLTVELWTSAAWESPGARTASTTTDSDGLWAFDSQAADTTKWIVVVIDSNGNKYLIDGRNEIQLTELDLVTKLQADTINEHTSATGVTIDGLLIKDNHIQFPEATNPAGSIVYGSRDNTGDLTLNALSGKAINLAINGSDEITVTSAGLNLPANSDINFTGTTGTNDIKLTDSLADALSITRGGTDMVLFDSSTPRITFTPVTTFTGTITGPSGTWDSGGVDIAASDSYAVAGTAILSDSSGTMTLSNVDALDATTEATIEGAIDTLSNLASVGTITTGVWQGTDVGVAYGGTGASTLTANGVLIGNGSSAIGSVDMSTKGHVLIGDGSGNPQMLGVGTDTHVLTADDGETTGVKWAAPAAAAAGSLTGSTLASGVTASSLTSVGTLSSPTLTTPTISSTGFTNATHAHAAANSGGVLPYGTVVFIPGPSWVNGGGASASTYGAGYAGWRLSDGANDAAQVTGPVVIICGASANIAYHTSTGFAQPGENQNSNTDSEGSSGTPLTLSITSNYLTKVNITASFTGATAGEIFSLLFTRDGAHADDTTSADLDVIGLLIEY